MLSEMRKTRLVFTILAIAVVGVLIFVGTLIKLFNDTALLRGGVQTVGQIVDKAPFIYTANDGKRYQRYGLTYNFIDENGQSFENWNEVEKSTYDQYQVEQAIDLHYFQHDPSVSAVGIDEKVESLRTQLIIGGALSLLGLIGILLLDYESRSSKD